MEQHEPEVRRRSAWLGWAPVVLFALAALAGVVFAGLSTYDYVQHLDRQLHGIHCSFLPGLGALDASGASGCSQALMSPWSAVLRSFIWGGVPVSLPGMALFSFMLFRGVDLWIRRRECSPGAWSFLAVVAVFPVVASVVMGAVAVVHIGTLCKLCVGIYASSVVAFGAALWGWYQAHGRRSLAADPFGCGPGPWIVAGAEGATFLLLPLVLYLLLAPDASGVVGACGGLDKPDDPTGVLVALDDNTGGTPVIEVLDPLCGACRAFERRYQATGRAETFQRRALLFPLDSTCNWMVSEDVHPGACAVSEAVLCAGDRGREVLDWAYREQDPLRVAAQADPAQAAALVAERFPDVAACMGSAAVRARLNRGLRWAVANQLPVLMPQLFVDGRKVCDEDTDLGLDYALAQLLDPAAPATPEP
ncbi:MAG: vitamin K epoxide reductase family protein [Pseudomonadota bacterium]